MKFDRVALGSSKVRKCAKTMIFLLMFLGSGVATLVNSFLDRKLDYDHYKEYLFPTTSVLWDLCCDVHYMSSNNVAAVRKQWEGTVDIIQEVISEMETMTDGNLGFLEILDDTTMPTSDPHVAAISQGNDAGGFSVSAEGSSLASISIEASSLHSSSSASLGLGLYPGKFRSVLASEEKALAKRCTALMKLTRILFRKILVRCIKACDHNHVDKLEWLDLLCTDGEELMAYIDDLRCSLHYPQNTQIVHGNAFMFAKVSMNILELAKVHCAAEHLSWFDRCADQYNKIVIAIQERNPQR